jgi:Mg/Co/Ni transporter MgtE
MRSKNTILWVVLAAALVGVLVPVILKKTGVCCRTY